MVGWMELDRVFPKYPGPSNSGPPTPVPVSPSRHKRDWNGRLASYNQSALFRRIALRGPAGDFLRRQITRKKKRLRVQFARADGRSVAS